MKICLVGYHNLPVLAPEYENHTVGGESVQQTLLGKALVRRGHQVSMAVGDYGQVDGTRWEAIRVFKTYAPDAGLPLLRFFHPRWTGMWSALVRADAEIYYTSCAGAHVGLLASFCRHFRRRFVFRTASDTDCDGSRLLVRFAHERWLYGYGLQHADAILVQSASQAKDLMHNYRLRGRVARMLVERQTAVVARDIDVLWVSNIRRVKRPDRLLRLAEKLPNAKIHMAGGPLAGHEALFREVQRAAAGTPNLSFHGPLSYREANELYGRAKLLVNTSDVEGFPNSYLQAWMRGVPVVALIDPDRIIEREGLGVAAESVDQISRAVSRFLCEPDALESAGDRCRAFMEREYGEDKVMSDYLDTFEQVLRADRANADLAGAHHA